MRLLIEYELHARHWHPPAWFVRWSFRSNSFSYQILSSEIPGRWPVICEAAVVPDNLSVVDYPHLQEPEIVVPEQSAANAFAQNVTCALSFLEGTRLWISSNLFTGTRLVRESAEDDAIIERLGASRIHIVTGTMALPFHQLISEAPPSDLISGLLDRQIGVELYYDAMVLSRPVDQYKQLWRVLESGTGLIGAPLVKVLASFPPFQEVGCDELELDDLRMWRDRAGHASSRGGIDELRRVRGAIQCRLHRLVALSALLILTKETWGTKGVGARRLADSPYLSVIARHLKVQPGTTRP